MHGPEPELTGPACTMYRKPQKDLERPELRSDLERIKARCEQLLEDPATA